MMYNDEGRTPGDIIIHASLWEYKKCISLEVSEYCGLELFHLFLNFSGCLFLGVWRLFYHSGN